MHVTLRQLQIFRAVAHSGSTAAAALSLPLSQSAASAALNELERVLQARLFDRVGKRLVLNDNGRAALPMALAILDGARNLESSFLTVDQQPLANLHLYASSTIGNYVLPPLLASFRTLLPDAQIEVRIGNTGEVLGAVAGFATDLGLIEGPCHRSDMTVIPWLQDELVLVAAPAHPLAHAAGDHPLTLVELSQAPWVWREPGSGTREAVEQALAPHLVNLRPAMTLGSSEAIKHAVAQGLGIACLSRTVVRDQVAAGRLTVLTTRLPRLTRSLALVHHRQKLLSASLRQFMSHCRGCAALPEWPDPPW